MTDPDGDIAAAIQRDLQEAFGAVLARHERSMVTKWVALIETMDQDGVRGMWPLATGGMTAWDTKGMLLEALDMEQGKTLADYVCGE